MICWGRSRTETSPTTSGLNPAISSYLVIRESSILFVKYLSTICQIFVKSYLSNRESSHFNFAPQQISQLSWLDKFASVFLLKVSDVVCLLLSALKCNQIQVVTQSIEGKKPNSQTSFCSDNQT